MSGQSTPRHELDFYVMALWRLHEIAHMVGTRCNEQPAKDADALFLAELPSLRDLRNWWVHPPDPGQLGWVTWFAHEIDRLLPDGLQYPGQAAVNSGGTRGVDSTREGPQGEPSDTIHFGYVTPSRDTNP
jgi:hypothetical protein